MKYTYENLREEYSKFIYESFTTNIEDGKLEVTYHFSIPGLAEFNPSLHFDLEHPLIINNPLSDFARKLLFSIGMVELISYWKIACPPTVEIKAGTLNNKQIEWWKTLYFNGLGEFFYINGIDAHLNDFMHIESNNYSNNLENSISFEFLEEVPLITENEANILADKMAQEEAKDSINEDNNINENNKDFISKGLNIIPVGGGKDSIVTIEHLKDYKENNLLLGINPTKASIDTMKIADYDEPHRYIVTRALDQNMLELNKAGYLNGHTPFSAVVAFISYFVAYLCGGEYIILSNEASANAATIPGTEINHQYSKTSEFEHAFQDYSRKYFSNKIYYFSLLRPFAELAIARSFVQYKQYFANFRSCNRGSKNNIWCGNCSKCLFIYAMLSPFLKSETLVDIFGNNLWNNENLVDDWLKLLGVEEQKPFECVGTVEEVQYALAIVINQYLQNKIVKDASNLPLLLKLSVDSIKNGDLPKLRWNNAPEHVENLSNHNPLDIWHDSSKIPEQFIDLIKDILN